MIKNQINLLKKQNLIDPSICYLAKIKEILFNKTLEKIIEEGRLILNHQFEFRSKHSTTKQVQNRIVDKINYTCQTKKYCSATFLDVSQTFNKVWLKIYYNQSILEGLIRAMPQLTERNQLM